MVGPVDVDRGAGAGPGGTGRRGSVFAHLRRLRNERAFIGTGRCLSGTIDIHRVSLPINRWNGMKWNGIQRDFHPDTIPGIAEICAYFTPFFHGTDPIVPIGATTEIVPPRCREKVCGLGAHSRSGETNGAVARRSHTARRGSANVGNPA